ncbi:MAG: Rv1355c family protein, partial [Luteimonas sp.]
EADFVWLRTNRNQHKITAEEQSLLANKKIGIVGLSVGQSIALTLALERSCGELRLADFDVIDLSNLNRLRCGIHNIGLSKTVIAAREIAELDPYLKVVCFSDGYNDSNSEAFLSGLDVVVDECDSLDVKFSIREQARARGIPVLMNASDRGSTDIERFDLEPQRPFFHGTLGSVNPDQLVNLDTEGKIPIILAMIGLPTTSARLRASMMEIGQTIKTWPQLGADVTLGGAIVCDVARRLLLGEPVASGRYHMDLHDIGTPEKSTALSAGYANVASIQTISEAGNRIATYAPDAIAQIMADAALAPSAGNVQPWHWERDEKGVTLEHRRGEQSSVLYYDDRAAMVGLGASFESALISAHHYGFDARAVFDFGTDALARIELRKADAIPEEPLHPYLAQRRSVRTRPSIRKAIAPEVLTRITGQLETSPGYAVAWLTRSQDIDTAAELLGEAERLRILDPESHTDMMREIAWSESEHRLHGEGIPMSSLSLAPSEEAALQVLRDPHVVRTLSDWKLGQGLATLMRSLVTSSSAIGLLWCTGSAQQDFFAGGRALQRLWLDATRAGLGLCPVTPICYMLGAWRAGRSLTALQSEAMPGLEARYRDLFGVPAERGDIAVFRLVHAADAAQAPRTTFRRTRYA